MKLRSLTQDQVDFYRENGYLVVKDFLTDEEVAKFKKGCKKRPVGDTACHPDFDHITISPRTVDIIKDLLGEKVIYPGLSFTRTEDFAERYGSRHLHSDAAYEHNDFSRDIPIINTGMYLQDQINYSGTLKVIPGSHTRQRILISTVLDGCKKIVKLLLKGKLKSALGIFDARGIVSVDSGPRDLILWSVRIHHSGYGLRFKWFPRLSLIPVFENWIPKWMHMPLNPERDVILTVYAAPGEEFESYINVQKRKAHQKEHYSASCLGESGIQSIAKEAGITIRNDNCEYAQDPNSTFSVHGRRGVRKSGESRQ